MEAVRIPKKRVSKLRQVPLRADLMAVTGGDMIAALVLKQMMYWTEKLEDLDRLILEENQRLVKYGMDQVDYSEGWIYKSHRQMREELFNCVSEDTIGRAFSKLTSMGLFQTRRNPKFQYDRTFQYRLDLILLRRLMNDSGFVLSDFVLDSENEIDLPIPHGAESSPLIAGAIPEIINIEVSSSLRSEETTPTPFSQNPENQEDPEQPELIPSRPKKEQSASDARSEATSESKVRLPRLATKSQQQLRDAQARICRFFPRNPKTPWSQKELTALKAILHTDPEEWEAVEEYYRHRGEDGYYCRTSVITMLNNWGREIEKAQGKKGEAEREEQERFKRDFAGMF